MERLNRHPERGLADRAALDALLDSQWLGTLSTVSDGQPWAVPMLYARDGDRLVLHGSTGAGALRHVAHGAPAVLTVAVVDALVVGATTFASSVNYRSATVHGSLRPCIGEERARALDAFSEALIPGRTVEVRPSSSKELAATLVMALEIADGNWLLKARTGWPSDPAAAEADPDTWTGIVPRRTTYGAPVPAPWSQSLPIPASVRRLGALTPGDQPAARSEVH
jgi:uncharacterized protein